MNIYVGNLSRDVTEDDLKGLFSKFGQVKSVIIIKDKFTGESRGFAFVEMPGKQEAEKAISALNGSILKQNSIRVNEARPKTENRQGYGRSYFDNRPGRGGHRGSSRRRY